MKNHNRNDDSIYTFISYQLWSHQWDFLTVHSRHLSCEWNTLSVCVIVCSKHLGIIDIQQNWSCVRTKSEHISFATTHKIYNISKIEVGTWNEQHLNTNSNSAGNINWFVSETRTSIPNNFGQCSVHTSEQNSER